MQLWTFQLVCVVQWVPFRFRLSYSNNMLSHGLKGNVRRPWSWCHSHTKKISRTRRLFFLRSKRAAACYMQKDLPSLPLSLVPPNLTLSRGRIWRKLKYWSFPGHGLQASAWLNLTCENWDRLFFRMLWKQECILSQKIDSFHECYINSI